MMLDFFMITDILPERLQSADEILFREDSSFHNLKGSWEYFRRRGWKLIMGDFYIPYLAAVECTSELNRLLFERKMNHQVSS